jgi:hypothetical protein
VVFASEAKLYLDEYQRYSQGNDKVISLDKRLDGDILLKDY